MKLKCLKMNRQSLKKQVNNEKGSLFKGKIAKSSRLSTSVENLRQISFFIRNKANSLNVQMNLTYLITMNYTIFICLTKVKNKAKTNPIAKRPKMMQSVYLQGIMKKNADRSYEKTKPKQTQIEVPAGT